MTRHTAWNGYVSPANMALQNVAIKALEDTMHNKHEDVTSHISRRIVCRSNNIV